MLEIKQTPSGNPTVVLNGRYLHSSRDPVREAQRSVADLVRREPPCIVLLGIGLGYAAEELLTQTETTLVIAFEPNSELKDMLAASRSSSRLIESPRLRWCNSASDLRAVLPEAAANGFEVLRLPGRAQADPEPFRLADEVLESFRSRIEINANTLKRFGRRWIRNLCRNAGVLRRALPVQRLHDGFAGIPGLLLAAGPGLDQILEDLPELAEHAVVVAVDTAVPAALSRGVIPDIAVVVDPQYWNARHLDSVRPSRTLLVAESSTHSSVFEHFKPPHYICRSLFPLGHVVENALGELGTLGTGGSVSTTAWDLLRFSGCSPIYVAGLDLGFPGGQTHFSGSFFETLAVALSRRLNPAEQTIHRYLSSAGPFPVDAAGGGTVLTDRRMELYRAWFERQLASGDGVSSFTLTTGGAAVTGLPPCGKEHLLGHKPARVEISRRIGELSSVETPDHGEALRGQFAALVGELDALIDLGVEALVAVKRAEAAMENGGPVDLSPLAEIDSRISGSSGRAVAGFLMHEAIAAIHSGYGSAAVSEQVQASRMLYSELVDSAQFHREEIQRAIDFSLEIKTPETEE